MEEAFKKASTTTEEHIMLKQLAGKWKVTTKMWMMPGEDPQVSKGTSVAAFVLDGKFLKEDFVGSFMGKKFFGIGYTGFDTVSGEFSTLWMDSMGTMMTVMTGSYSPDSNTIGFSGKMSCPLSPEKLKVRSELKIVDKNNHVFTMYMTGPDGKETRSFEITYVRSK